MASELENRGGSHVIFHHSKWIEILYIPAHKPIKPVYIKKLINLIELLENETQTV